MSPLLPCCLQEPELTCSLPFGHLQVFALTRPPWALKALGLTGPLPFSDFCKHRLYMQTTQLCALQAPAPKAHCLSLDSACICTHMHLLSSIACSQLHTHDLCPLSFLGTHTQTPTVLLRPLHSPTPTCSWQLCGLSGHQDSAGPHIPNFMPCYVLRTDLHSCVRCTSLDS